MPSPLEHVEAGQTLSAVHQNTLVDRLNAVSRLSPAGALHGGHGSGGLQLSAPDRTRLAIWQLSGPMERAVTDGIPDDVPSAPAAPVWYFPVDGTAPENEYTETPAYSRSARVYYVAGFPGDQRDQLQQLSPGQPGDTAIPKFGPGDWVVARLNGQSGRWEIVEGPENLWRFELKTPLQPNGERDQPSTATAYLVVFDPQQGQYVRTSVEFPVADFLDIAQGQPGDRGYARRLADSHLTAGWEVLLLKPESSSSSSSESSSSSSSSSGSSSSESSSGGGGGGGCGGWTGNLDVLINTPQRQGNNLVLPSLRLSFQNGCLMSMENLPSTSIYLCCPDSSSSSGGSSESSSEEIPECIHVDGAISPTEAIGDYYQEGTFNGRPQWRHSAGNGWWIRWDDPYWVIGLYPGGSPPPSKYWLRPGQSPLGEYPINSGTEGTAIADACTSSSSSSSESSSQSSSQSSSESSSESSSWSSSGIAEWTIFYECGTGFGPYYASGLYSGVWSANASYYYAAGTAQWPDWSRIIAPATYYGPNCPSSSESGSESGSESSSESSSEWSS